MLLLAPGSTLNCMFSGKVGSSKPNDGPRRHSLLAFTPPRSLRPDLPLNPI